MLDTLTIVESVQAVASVFAMGISVFAIIRSNKEKQNENILKIQEAQNVHIADLGKNLQEHAEEDIRIQTELQTELKNNIKLAEKLDEKLDKVLERL
jgi:hypothetical protein